MGDENSNPQIDTTGLGRIDQPVVDVQNMVSILHSEILMELRALREDVRELRERLLLLAVATPGHAQRATTDGERRLDPAQDGE